MQADVSFSPSPALWVFLAIVVIGSSAAWIWVRRSRRARGPSARPAVLSLLGDVTETALPDGPMSRSWLSSATCGWTCATGLPVTEPSFASST
jgi:hypothetical protein